MSDIDNDDIRRLDGGLLLVFQALCRTRQTTATAARLGFSQSAVSQALARLRDIYADPLFLRRPHGLEPTARALALAPRIDALIEMMGSSLTSGLGFDPSSTTRQFNIALADYAAGLIGGRFVAELQRLAPHATFALQFFRGFDALMAVRRGRADLAIGRFDAAERGLKREPLVEDRYCIVARKDHPTIDGKVSRETWRKTGHIFASTSILRDDGVEGPAVGEDGIPPAEDVARVGFVPRWEIAYAMVAECDAIATGSRRLAVQMAKTHSLQIIDLPREATWMISMVRRDEIDDGLDWFCEQLRASAIEL